MCWAAFANPLKYMNGSQAAAFTSTAYSTLIDATTSESATAASTRALPILTTTIFNGTASARPSSLSNSSILLSGRSMAAITIASVIFGILLAAFVGFCYWRRFGRRLKQQKTIEQQARDSQQKPHQELSPDFMLVEADERFGIQELPATAPT